MTMEEFSTEARLLLEEVETQGLEPVTRWSATLRKKPLAEARREISILVSELLATNTHAARLLEIIEAIRPGIHQNNPATDQLPSQEDALQYMQLLEQELAVYEQIMQLSDEVDTGALSLAVHRSLAALIDRQLIYYQHYLPIPEREWVRIHRLFYISIERKIVNFATIDKIYFFGKSLSIMNLYCLSLLLGCGRLNRLTAGEISRLGKSMADWCALVSVSRKPASDSDNQLVVDITSGSAPSFRKLFAPADSTISCYLQIDKLIERLDLQIANESKREAEAARSGSATPMFGGEVQSLRSDVIRQLKSAWTEYIYREERLPTDETIQVCLGFDNIHFHLCGGQTLKEFLGSKMTLSIVYDDTDDAATINRQRSGDVWSAFLSAPEGKLVTGAIPAEFNFQHSFPEKNPGQQHADYLVHTIRMTDTSSKGCCLQWLTLTPEKPLEIGELVGLSRKDSPGQWYIGEIAWKHRNDNGETSTGIRFLGTRAIPLAFDIPLRFGSTENCAPAILFPPEDELGTRVSAFAVAPCKLQQGEYVTVSQKGIEEKIQLTATLKSSSFVESYECGFVVKNSIPGR